MSSCTLQYQRRNRCSHHQVFSWLRGLFVLVSLCSVLIINTVYAQQHGQVLTLVGAERIQAIGRDVEVMRTPLRKLGVQEIVQGVYAGQFQPSTRLYPNFGYTNDVLWFRVRLKNTTLDRIERVFDVGSVFLDSVALYESNPGGNFQESWAGGGIFIEQRAMKMRRAAFLLRLKPFEEKTVYVRAVGTLPMIFHFELYPHNDFVALQRQDANFDGMIWGMILCIAIFNVVQYLASQRFVYGLFAIHAITSLLALLSINGVLTEYIWLDVQGFGTRPSVLSYFSSGNVGSAAADSVFVFRLGKFYGGKLLYADCRTDDCCAGTVADERVQWCNAVVVGVVCYWLECLYAVCNGGKCAWFCGGLG